MMLIPSLRRLVLVAASFALAAPATFAEENAAPESGGDTASVHGALEGVISSSSRAKPAWLEGQQAGGLSPYDRQFEKLVADMHKAAQNGNSGRSLLHAAWQMATLSKSSTEGQAEETVLDPEFGTISLQSRSRWGQARIATGRRDGSAEVDPAAGIRRAWATGMRATYEADAAASAELTALRVAPMATADYARVPISTNNAPFEGFTGTGAGGSLSTGSVTFSAPAAAVPNWYGVVNAADSGSHGTVELGFSGGTLSVAAPVNLPTVQNFVAGSIVSRTRQITATSTVSGGSLTVTAQTTAGPQALSRHLVPTASIIPSPITSPSPSPLPASSESATTATAATPAVAPPAGPFTISPADLSSRGWYESDGVHDSTNDNYIAGNASGVSYNNFFVFNLSSIPGGQIITGATLNLYNPAGGFQSGDATETYQTFDVSTPIATLKTTSSAGGAGIAIYNDLGSGTAYSSGTNVGAASSNTTVSFQLNAAFIAYAQANLGSNVALGGSLTSLDASSGTAEYIFGGSGSGTVTTTTLVLTTVPEPGSLALAALGLAGCGVLRRRRR